MEDNIFDKIHEVDLKKTMAVSYTHLDVYKRQCSIRYSEYL